MKGSTGSGSKDAVEFQIQYEINSDGDSGLVLKPSKNGKTRRLPISLFKAKKLRDMLNVAIEAHENIPQTSPSARSSEEAVEDPEMEV